MKNIGSHLGGVYPVANPYWQLVAPEMTLTNIVLGDFFVFRPQVHILWRQAAYPKEDYDASAQVLSKHGPVVRANRISVPALHYQAGGCGQGQKRKRKDEAAREYLFNQWWTEDGSAVFCGSRNSQELRMYNGLQLIKDLDLQLGDAVSSLETVREADILITTAVGPRST